MSIIPPLIFKVLWEKEWVHTHNVCISIYDSSSGMHHKICNDVVFDISVTIYELRGTYIKFVLNGVESTYKFEDGCYQKIATIRPWADLSLQVCTSHLFDHIYRLTVTACSLAFGGSMPSIERCSTVADILITVPILKLSFPLSTSIAPALLAFPGLQEHLEQLQSNGITEVAIEFPSPVNVTPIESQRE